jgi:hypothetical protein
MKTRTLKALSFGGATTALLATAPLQASTLTLDFNAPGGGSVLDINGVSTGFTTRLPGTGASLAPHDNNLFQFSANGVLELTSQQSDFNGQANMDLTSAPGINLSTLGFTGAEDFSVTAVFRGPIQFNDAIDQLGVYVGLDSATLTRAGFITFASYEYFSGHTASGVDQFGHFYGFGLDTSAGMTVTISRTGGFWDYVINGVHWLPNTVADGTGSYIPADFLDYHSDLVVGIFAITPFNSSYKVYSLDSFTVTVVPEPSSSCLLGLGTFVGVWLRRRHRSKLKSNFI